MLPAARVPEGDESEVKLTVVKPKKQKTPVGVIGLGFRWLIVVIVGRLDAAGVAGAIGAKTLNIRKNRTKTDRDRLPRFIRFLGETADLSFAALLLVLEAGSVAASFDDAEEPPS